MPAELGIPAGPGSPIFNRQKKETLSTAILGA